MLCPSRPRDKKVRRPVRTRLVRTRVARKKVLRQPWGQDDLGNAAVAYGAAAGWAEDRRSPADRGAARQRPGRLRGRPAGAGGVAGRLPAGVHHLPGPALAPHAAARPAWAVGPADRRSALSRRVMCSGAGRPRRFPVVQRFLERQRPEGHDLAVQLHSGGGHSNPFVNPNMITILIIVTGSTPIANSDAMRSTDEDRAGRSPVTGSVARILLDIRAGEVASEPTDCRLRAWGLPDTSLGSRVCGQRSRMVMP